MSFGASPTQIYRKHHLVPFGDYFPQWTFITWVMNAMQIPMSSFSRGDAVQTPLAVAGQHVAVNICYEDAFGEELIRQLPHATILANFTNDAWWGDSFASEQHLQISQMRAQETGRYMLRATNTGVTAIIDQRGRVLAAAPQFVTTALDGLAQGYTGSTPYVRWGNWVVLGSSRRCWRWPSRCALAGLKRSHRRGAQAQRTPAEKFACRPEASATATPSVKAVSAVPQGAALHCLCRLAPSWLGRRGALKVESRFFRESGRHHPPASR